MKRCALCHEWKTEARFSRDDRKKDGLRSRCKDCVSDGRKLTRERDNEISRRWKAKYVYMVVPGEYDALYEKQKGCCAVCGTHQSVLGKRLSIDHDHATGLVRGLLCSSCNLALGLMRDNIDVLFNAAIYLKQHASK